MREQLQEVQGCVSGQIKKLAHEKTKWIEYKAASLTDAEAAKAAHDEVKTAGDQFLRSAEGPARVAKKALNDIRREMAKAEKDASKFQAKEPCSTHPSV